MHPKLEASGHPKARHKAYSDLILIYLHESLSLIILVYISLKSIKIFYNQWLRIIKLCPKTTIKVLSAASCPKANSLTAYPIQQPCMNSSKLASPSSNILINFLEMFRPILKWGLLCQKHLNKKIIIDFILFSGRGRCLERISWISTSGLAARISAGRENFFQLIAALQIRKWGLKGEEVQAFLHMPPVA